MAFLPIMEEWRERLVARGHEVLLPPLRWPKDGSIHPPLQKAEAIREHFSKIEESDAVLIVNPEKRGIAGYIGGNSLMEMALAFYLKKPIYLTEMRSDVSYAEEVGGMLPRSVEELLA